MDGRARPSSDGLEGESWAGSISEHGVRLLFRDTRTGAISGGSRHSECTREKQTLPKYSITIPPNEQTSVQKYIRPCLFGPRRRDDWRTAERLSTLLCEVRQSNGYILPTPMNTSLPGYHTHRRHMPKGSPTYTQSQRESQAQASYYQRTACEPSCEFPVQP